MATYDLSPMLGGNALNGLIKQIGEDRDGSLWLSTEAGLLHLYVGERKILGHRLFRNQRSDAASLASDLVLSVLEDPAEPAKYLWVCTRGGGVDKLEKQTGVCVHHTMRDGLPNNVVYGAINDDYGRIWFSTNNGLSCFIPGKRYFRNFSTEDGLQDNEFNTASFFKDGNGRLFFGGVGGSLCSILPKYGSIPGLPRYSLRRSRSTIDPSMPKVPGLFRRTDGVYGGSPALAQPKFHRHSFRGHRL